ncbi:Hypothetical predicted protein [Octopus vulgaris]|uniref:Uncharacterized protein n=1 Tax=Octopus vulgaris TaxID=6645 RepID=A0AA36EZA2_OCTVU|nr:Hypothetical predicted protein [Octopus vulgaris]
MSDGKMSDGGSPSKENVVGSPTSKIAKIDETKLKIVEGSPAEKAVKTAKVAEGSPSDEVVKATEVIEGSPSKGNDKTTTYNFAAAARKKMEEIKMEEIDYENYKKMFTKEGNNVKATLPQIFKNSTIFYHKMDQNYFKSE